LASASTLQQWQQVQHAALWSCAVVHAVQKYIAALSRSVAAGLPDPDPRYPIALLTRDPLTTLCAMLGALRNDNLYFVPAPDQPPARLRRQLSVSGAQTVVADADLLPLAREAADGLCTVQLYREAPVSGSTAFTGETRSGTDPARSCSRPAPPANPKGSPGGTRICYTRPGLTSRIWNCTRTTCTPIYSRSRSGTPPPPPLPPC